MKSSHREHTPLPARSRKEPPARAPREPVEDVARLCGLFSGDVAAACSLVAELTSVIERRASRALRRRRASAGHRDAAQEVEDLCQEVLLRLFSDGAATLKRWDPSREVPLAQFVTVIADREIASIFRRRRRSPWGEHPTETGALEILAGSLGGPDDHLEARATLRKIVQGARARLHGRGLDMLQWLILDLRPTEEICGLSGLSRDAVYAWSSRLQRILREVAASSLHEKESPRC